MNYYVYHIHLDGMGLDQGYIGVTKDPKQRWRKHKKKSTESYVSDRIKEHGDDIKYTILATYDTREDALWTEYTLRHKMNMGWNVAKGGATCPMDGLDGHSEATKKKMSKTHTGSKWSKARVEDYKKNPRGGWKLSEETVEKMRQMHKGHKSANARPVNLYNFHTDELIAENVVIREWCKENGLLSGHTGLYRSLKADHSKPSSKTNVRHSKGIYARYVDEET